MAPVYLGEISAGKQSIYSASELVSPEKRCSEFLIFFFLLLCPCLENEAKITFLLKLYGGCSRKFCFSHIPLQVVASVTCLVIGNMLLCLSSGAVVSFGTKVLPCSRKLPAW